MGDKAQAIFKANQTPIKKTTTNRKGRTKKDIPDSFKLSGPARFVAFVFELGVMAMAVPMVLILVVLLFKCLKYALGLQIK